MQPGGGAAEAPREAGLDPGAGGPRGRWRSPAPAGHAFSCHGGGGGGGGPADMDLGPVTICGEVTVLHGGFLLASSLCHPKALSELAKSDWPVVGRPIVDALQEICTSYSSYPPEPDAWKKKAAVVLWSKVLLSEAPASASSSANQRWKDDVFFSVSTMIPEVNHTVLFELFKEVNAPRLFAQLLLALPDALCQREAATFVEYVAQETSPADVSFFLDVWWEVIKHREGQEDRMTLLFQTVSRQYLLEPDETGQPAKRFKGESTASPGSPPAASVLPILLGALKEIKGSIEPPRLKCYALANLVEVLSFLVAPECPPETLTVHVYLDKVSSIVTLWSSDCKSQYQGKDLGEKVEEAEKSISLTAVPRLPGTSLPEDMRFFCALLQEWSPELQVFLNDRQQVSYESYRLLEGLSSLEKKLAGYTPEEDANQEMAQATLELREAVGGFLKAIHLESWGTGADSSLAASVAMVIIEKRMERHREMCAVFASEKSWAFTQDWVACLVKNKDLFQEPGLVLKLLETLAAFSHGADAPQSHEQVAQVAKVLLGCYAELTLEDQNEVISGVLASWGREGLSGVSAVFSEGFQEDLNVTFNQIIQSSSGEGFKKAVSAVSRLVLLNPAATVKMIGNLAVSNLGTHQFLAEILCSFSALKSQGCPGGAEGSLLMACLKDAVWDRLCSAKDKEQFLEFLEYLMQPSGASPVLSPVEVIQSLVLPYLKSDSPCVELSLQVLEKVLKVPAGSEENWISTCHPFPLLFCLCKLLDRFHHYWHDPQSQEAYPLETKDLVASNLSRLCDTILIQKESISPELWVQSVSWLHKKAGALDWTIGLRLRNVYGDHFKNEVPGTLFEVCKLPEDKWTSRPLPSYGPGSGLLAWLECCCVSSALREQMLVLLVVNVDDPEEVNLFSKGFLVALVQVFPWCTHSEWKRLAHVVKSLLEREVLYVPYSLEYVQQLPLLNFRPFAYHLQFSVLLLRSFQFLCGSSGCTWLSEEAWKHVARLYCLSISELLTTVKSSARGQWHAAEDRNVTRELSFVYIQLFCHTLHVAAMLPDAGAGEPLLLLSLEILSHYEMLYDADESLGSALRKANERHFLESIAENVTNAELRKMLRQKLRKL